MSSSKPLSPTQLVVSWIAVIGVCSLFVHSLYQKTTKEGWWGGAKFNPRVNNLIDNGRVSNPQNYQAQLPNFYAPQKQQEMPSNFYQVPGKYDGKLSPRFYPGCLAAQVQYNLPSINNMACEPTNPLSYAQAVQTLGRTPDKPDATSCIVPQSTGQPTKENFQYPENSTSYQAQVDAMDLRNDSTVISANTLPVPTMVDLHGGTQGIGPSDQPTVSYDRFIVANLNRQRGYGDWIRGDLNINPILPNGDVNSPIWFRPSSGVEVLNTGAMAVLGGVYNETNRATCDLSMAGTGGAVNTLSGTALARMGNTSMGAQIAQNAINLASNKSIGHIGLGDAQVATYA